MFAASELIKMRSKKRVTFDESSPDESPRFFKDKRKRNFRKRKLTFRRLKRQTLFQLLTLLSVVSSFYLIGYIIAQDDAYSRNKGDLTPYSKCDLVMIEVTGAANLTNIQMCALEAAVRHHANLTTCLLAGRAAYHDLSSLNPIREQVQRHLPTSHLSVIPFDPDAIFQWTPVMNWWREEFRYDASSPKRDSNLSKIAGLAFVFKYGGIFVDFDFKVLKSLEELGDNFVAMQDADHATASLIGMKDRAEHLLLDVLFDIPEEFNAISTQDEANVADAVLTKVLRRLYLGKDSRTLLMALQSQRSNSLNFTVIDDNNNSNDNYVMDAKTACS